MLRELDAFAPDVLVARRAMFDLPLDRLIVACRLPFVAEVNAVAASEALLLGEARVPRREVLRERQFIRAADLRICVTDEVRDDLLKHGEQEASTITVQNGVDTHLFSPDVVPDREAAEWKGAHDRVVAFCGTFVDTLDSGTMGTAMQMVMDDVPSARFLFVGATAGAVSASLGVEAGHDPRLLCTGPVAHARVPHLLATADVCWAAFNQSYTSPLKLYEYMAMAKPVVIAAAGQPVQVVTNAGCGRVQMRGDAAGLAYSVSALLRMNADERRELGERGRAWVATAGTWAQAAASMVKAMDTLQEAPRRKESRPRY